jgi:tRNA/tmRNA/rRNA uracil-C5-methylase (TrmA/RlmC/RlmD family)
MQSRARSGAFPFELPCRLINMYSVYGDVVLDPFAGTGTVALAACATGRCSVGYELAADVCDAARRNAAQSIDSLRNYTNARLLAHRQFIEALPEEKKAKLYSCEHYPFQVKTRQEMKIRLPELRSITPAENGVTCEVEL